MRYSQLPQLLLSIVALVLELVALTLVRLVRKTLGAQSWRHLRTIAAASQLHLSERRPFRVPLARQAHLHRLLHTLSCS